MELLLVNPNFMNRVMYDTMRDMDRAERRIFPYWRNADHSVLHVANDTVKAVDDDKKFAVSLDVSQFRPEELNVHLDGRVLTVEGKQEHKTKNSSMHRSFTRKWLLPENVDLDAVRTQVDNKGHLSVDAPKHIEGHPKKRRIPITAAPSASSAPSKKRRCGSGVEH
ncbi:Hsp20/alpha crystallin family protein [Ostertagia ostertagi]